MSLTEDYIMYHYYAQEICTSHPRRTRNYYYTKTRPSPPNW